jgi:hypothetical protein
VAYGDLFVASSGRSAPLGRNSTQNDATPGITLSNDTVNISTSVHSLTSTNWTFPYRRSRPGRRAHRASSLRDTGVPIHLVQQAT